MEGIPNFAIDFRLGCAIDGALQSPPSRAGPHRPLRQVVLPQGTLHR